MVLTSACLSIGWNTSGVNCNKIKATHFTHKQAEFQQYSFCTNKKETYCIGCISAKTVTPPLLLRSNGFPSLETGNMFVSEVSWTCVLQFPRNLANVSCILLATQPTLFRSGQFTADYWIYNEHTSHHIQNTINTQLKPPSQRLITSYQPLLKPCPWPWLWPWPWR